MAISTPPSATKRPAGGVSTPSHLSYHASPTASRQPAGKTPVNHPTSASTGSKTLAGTPMVHNLSQTGMTSSPSANLFGFPTPSGLLADGPTPAGLNVPTPGLAGTAMMPTMSELGLTAGGAKRNEDEERRSKMRKVLRSIGQKKGKVSEEGIARVGRRVGFQNDIDVEKLTPAEMERKVGNRAMSTAGSVVVVDLHLKDNVPYSLKVSFDQPSEALRIQESALTELLFDDLKAIDKLPLKSTLSQFAIDLERLARIDRLSGKGINCFEALTGIYTGLCRLHEQELLAVKASAQHVAADQDQAVSAEVLRKKSGKPVAHDRGNVGIELLYWSQIKKITTPLGVDHDEIYAIRLDVESSSAGLFPSLRVSDSWLPNPLELSTSNAGGGIPWQEPPPSFVTESPDAINGQKLPDLRFTAILHPPLVMPYQTAMNVLALVGAPAPQMHTMPPQYAALLLGDQVEAQFKAAADLFKNTSKQTVLSQKDGMDTTVNHRYTLSSAKVDYGFELAEIPFSHPRQLVELLPTLRQWASVGSLLRDLFVRGSATNTPQAVSDECLDFDGRRIDATTLQDLIKTPANTPSRDVPINIALATSPIPTLSITFPDAAEHRTNCVNIQVLPNADLAVVYQETSGASDGHSLARALDVCGDIGVWIEWMRSKH